MSKQAQSKIWRTVGSSDWAGHDCVRLPIGTVRTQDRKHLLWAVTNEKGHSHCPRLDLRLDVPNYE